MELNPKEKETSTTRVYRVISDITGIAAEDLTPEIPVSDLLDSIDRVEFIMAMEEEFDRELPFGHERALADSWERGEIKTLAHLVNTVAALVMELPIK